MDPPEQSAALRLVEHAVDGGERLDQAGRSLLPGGAQPGGRFGFVHGWMRDQVGDLEWFHSAMFAVLRKIVQGDAQPLALILVREP